MRIIRRYVGRQIAFSILLVLSALIMLFSFFDLIYELRDVGHGEYRLGSALIFVLLSLPGRLYEMFPVAALIGTMFALAQMVLHSEYAVMRTSGVSILAMAGALLQIGLAFAIVAFVTGEFLTGAAGQSFGSIKYDVTLTNASCTPTAPPTASATLAAPRTICCQ